MDTTVFCSFDQRLTPNDIGRLARLIGAVIPIPHRHHLVGSTRVGLHAVVNDKLRDYSRVRRRLRDMTPTVLRQVEGNQMVLEVPTHGQVYTIKNTGPVVWEKGDVLTLLPPIFTPDGEATPTVTVGDWQLILPWVVPMSLAVEINQRMVLLALLALDRSQEEIRAVSAQLRTVRYRDATVTLPEAALDDHALVDLKNVCISLSMIANLSTQVISNYVRKLALEDSNMLLMKCQEILSSRRAAATAHAVSSSSSSSPGGAAENGESGDAGGGGGGGPPWNLSPTEELNKLTALFVMIRQVVDVISEEPQFLVCDLSPDDAAAVCIFKG